MIFDLRFSNAFRILGGGEDVEFVPHHDIPEILWKRKYLQNLNSVWSHKRSENQKGEIDH